MKQAIEEGFILDVLANYTNYKSYYEIENPYEQGDIITKKLKELINKINSGEFDIDNFYKENKHKLIDTKQKIFANYADNIKQIQNFIF